MWVGADILRWAMPRLKRHLTIAQPPCTHLTLSGTHAWKRKGLKALIEGLTLFDRARELCEGSSNPWMLENPKMIDACIHQRWRRPNLTFHPHHYAGYSGDFDRYPKGTAIWHGGGFVAPLRADLGEDSRLRKKILNRSGKGDGRAVAPVGFARAVWLYNDPTLPEGVRAKPTAKVGIKRVGFFE